MDVYKVREPRLQPEHTGSMKMRLQARVVDEHPKCDTGDWITTSRVVSVNFARRFVITASGNMYYWDD